MEDVYIMAIDKLTTSHATQGVSGVKRTHRVQNGKSPNSVVKHDAVNVRTEVKSADKRAYSNAMSTIMNAPDIRADKVEALMKDPSSYRFPSSEVLQAVAKKLVKDFFGF